MILARTIAQARASRQFLGSMAFVPTMGALHEGHLSLIKIAREKAPSVAVSIFVNPTQFGPREDFSKYPRPLEDDLEKCRAAGVDLVFIPAPEEMYPGLKVQAPAAAPSTLEPTAPALPAPDRDVFDAAATAPEIFEGAEMIDGVEAIDFTSNAIEEPVFTRQTDASEPSLAPRPLPLAPVDLSIDIPSLTTVLEGKFRPGHFKGVLQVVNKLFNILTPDFACFGQKDFQQLRVITAMVEALNMPVQIVPCPTLRDPDGLAMSSRNRYLSANDRKRALALSQALFGAAGEVKKGITQAPRLLSLIQRTLTLARCQIDYVAAVDPITLKSVQTIKGPTALLIAAKVGTTRLIDNLVVEPALTASQSPAPASSAGK